MSAGSGQGQGIGVVLGGIGGAWYVQGHSEGELGVGSGRRGSLGWEQQDLLGFGGQERAGGEKFWAWDRNGGFGVQGGDWSGNMGFGVGMGILG